MSWIDFATVVWVCVAGLVAWRMYLDAAYEKDDKK